MHANNTDDPKRVSTAAAYATVVRPLDDYILIVSEDEPELEQQEFDPVLAPAANDTKIDGLDEMEMKPPRVHHHRPHGVQLMLVTECSSPVPVLEVIGLMIGKCCLLCDSERVHRLTLDWIGLECMPQV